MKKLAVEKQLGKAVRLRRQSLGLSQEALAHRSGLHRTYMTDIERGTRNPSLRTIAHIAAGLGVAIDTLLAGITVEPSRQTQFDRHPK